MKLVTWNINGLRSIKEPIKSFLDKLEADIICFQETKVTKDQIESELALVDGYSSYFSFSQTRQGYSGVATYCNAKSTPVRAQEGLFNFAEKSAGIGVIGHYGDLMSIFAEDRLHELDKEGRTVITQHKYFDSSSNKNENCTIINVYCPRADPEKPERQVFKMDFYKVLQERANGILKSGSHVIICGDINTSHRRIDHCNPDDPESFYENPCREWMDGILFNKGDYSALKMVDIPCSFSKCSEVNIPGSYDLICDDLDTGVNKNCDKGNEVPEIDVNNLQKSNHNNNCADFVDTFRFFFPNRKEAFTCWNTMKSCRETNYGTRIDYIFANSDFHVKHIKMCDILPEVYGSDHCPVKAVIEIDMIPETKCPPCCTKYMPEFGGRQQTLSKFFSRSDKSSQQVNLQEKSKTSTSVFFSKPSLSNTRKRKIEKGKTNESKTKQTKLSFFNKYSSARVETDSKTAGFKPRLINSFVNQKANPKLEFMPKIEKNASKKASNETSKFWKSVLKGPEPPPLCTGHDEPCFLRTVKKEGPNMGKEFYCCRRPEGHKTNPEARCPFFQWKP